MNTTPSQSPMQGALYVIRHGSTALNGKGKSSVDKIRGWSDVPLDSQGKKEAAATGEELKGSGITTIFCSDLSRAQETAQIIGNIIGVQDIEPSDNYRPWNLGVFTGQASKKVAPQMLQYVENPDDPVPEGESFNDFKFRDLGALQSLIQMVQQGAIIALVTHFRVAKLIEAWIAAGAPPTFDIDPNVFEADDAPTGSFAVVSFTPDGRLTYGQPAQPDTEDELREVVKIANDPNKRAQLGTLLKNLVQAGLDSKGECPVWWETCKAYHRGEFRNSDSPGEGLVPVQFPFSAPRQDMLTAQVCTVVTKQEPYMLADDASGKPELEEKKEAVLHKFWQRGGFEKAIRQASNVCTDTNLAWVRVYFERTSQKPFSGLNWDVIPPEDITIFPAGVGGIAAARIVGHRFYLRVKEVKAMQEAGTYFDDVQIRGGDSPATHDDLGDLRNSGVNPNVMSTDPLDERVELFQVVFKYAEKPNDPEQNYIATFAFGQAALLTCDPYEYSRPWYFDASYIQETNQGYYPGVSVARNLSGMQDCYNKLGSSYYNNSQIACYPPVFGPELPEKDFRYSAGQYVPADMPAQNWSPNIKFDGSQIMQMLELIDILGDRVARVSANTMGSSQDKSTTATENSIIASGVAVGLEEYIGNFTTHFPEIADFTMELLIAHFKDWMLDAAALGVVKDDLLAPCNWEVNGKSPGNTPGAKIAASEQLLGLWQAFGPASGLDPYEVTKAVIANGPWTQGNNMQIPKEQLMPPMAPGMAPPGMPGMPPPGMPPGPPQAMPQLPPPGPQGAPVPLNLAQAMGANQPQPPMDITQLPPEALDFLIHAIQQGAA